MEPPAFFPPPAAGRKPPRIRFTPVPRQRQRRNGWTEKRQKDFILALSLCGSVTRAAKAVGMSARSAYRLLDADGADSFAKAWDRAMDGGGERARIEALERSLRGTPVAVFRRGKLQRIEHRVNDRLAIALLSGRDCAVHERRQSAALHRAHRLDLRVADAALAADGGVHGHASRVASDFVIERMEREFAGEKVERTGRERPWVDADTAPEPAPPRPEPRLPRIRCL